MNGASGQARMLVSDRASPQLPRKTAEHCVPARHWLPLVGGIPISCTALHVLRPPEQVLDNLRRQHQYTLRPICRCYKVASASVLDAAGQRLPWQALSVRGCRSFARVVPCRVRFLNSEPVASTLSGQTPKHPGAVVYRHACGRARV
jgi:hypothetical protein